MEPKEDKKEEPEEEEELDEEIEEEPDKRSGFGLQKFMDDMKMLGEQTNSRTTIKPFFNYGSLEVTNYLLWNILGELQLLSDYLTEED